MARAARHRRARGLSAVGTVDPDVAWQLWIAHQVNHGGRLYRDMVEVNPPLWFWMALPVDGRRLPDRGRGRKAY